MLKLTDKLDLRRSEKIVASSNLSIYCTWENIRSLYNSNKFKISAPTWNDKFELQDGSYSVIDIQYHFEYIFKKHGQNINNPSVRIYVNKIGKRITFKTKTGYHIELVTPKTIKLLGSTKNEKTKNKNIIIIIIIIITIIIWYNQEDFLVEFLVFH